MILDSLRPVPDPEALARFLEAQRPLPGARLRVVPRRGEAALGLGPDDPDAEVEPGPVAVSDDPEPPKARGFTLAALAAHVFPPRKALLCRGQTAIVREGHTGQVASARGVGKTWLLETLAIVAASHARALGIHAPEPCRVLYVDGEMASEEVQERFAKLGAMLGVQHAALPLTIVAADWQDDYLPRLDTRDGQAFIEPYVAEAALVILDNRSCLFDPEGEKDGTAWQPAQGWLLSLRRRGKAVLIGHHANRQGAARGHSKAEDMLKLSLKLSRPEAYTQDQGARFIVEFDKARGIHGTGASPFVAQLTEAGWALEDAEEDSITTKLRAYLQVADEIGERPRTASAAVSGAGVGKAAGLKAFATLVKTGKVDRHTDGGYCLTGGSCLIFSSVGSGRFQNLQNFQNPVLGFHTLCGNPEPSAVLDPRNRRSFVTPK